MFQELEEPCSWLTLPERTLTIVTLEPTWRTWPAQQARQAQQARRPPSRGRRALTSTRACWLSRSASGKANINQRHKYKNTNIKDYFRSVGTKGSKAPRACFRGSKLTRFFLFYVFNHKIWWEDENKSCRLKAHKVCHFLCMFYIIK